MNLLDVLPNLLALVFSLVAVVVLAIVAVKVGGLIGTMLKCLVAGIALAVMVHAGVELLATLGAVSETTLMLVMGVLLTIGSAFFLAAGYVGLKFIRS